MATKPSGVQPTWADDGAAVVGDPGAGKQALGFVVSEKPPAHWVNWILRTVGEWVAYLVDVTDENVPDVEYAYEYAAVSRLRQWETRTAAGSYSDAFAAGCVFDENHCVLVGAGGEIQISYSSGHLWEAAVVTASDDFTAVAVEGASGFAADSTCAVGTNGLVRVAPSGFATYSAPTTPPSTSETLRAVASAAVNEYVCCGDNQTLFISSDAGDTWSGLTVPSGVGASDDFTGIAGEGGTYILVSESVAKAWRSADSGATWTECTLPSGISDPKHVAFSSHDSLDRWVVAAEDTTWYSDDDGVTFTRTSGLPNPQGTAASGKVDPTSLVGSSSGYLMTGGTQYMSVVLYSPDGQRWNPVYSRTSENLRCFIGSRYAVVAGAFGNIHSTPLF